MKKIIHNGNKHWSNLTGNQYGYSINRSYKIYNFYKYSKLHKPKELNKIIKNSKYLNITENLEIAARPMVAGTVYYTSGISELLYIILETSLYFIPHILKESLVFDFLERLDTTWTEDTLLSLCDIKSLYTNICNDVFYKAINY